MNKKELQMELTKAKAHEVKTGTRYEKAVEQYIASMGMESIEMAYMLLSEKEIDRVNALTRHELQEWEKAKDVVQELREKAIKESLDYFSGEEKERLKKILNNTADRTTGMPTNGSIGQALEVLFTTLAV